VEVQAALEQAFTVLRAWDLKTTAREAALRRAGQHQAANVSRPKSWMIEVAIADAMKRANGPPFMVGLESFLGGANALGPRHVQPFTVSVPRPFGRENNEEGATH
jgi:hypothetical protein